VPNIHIDNIDDIEQSTLVSTGGRQIRTISVERAIRERENAIKSGG
jgi:hypothetical protein